MKNYIYFLVELANNCKSGNLDIVIGEHLLSNMEWGRALKWIEQGIEKGNLAEDIDARELLLETYEKLGRKLEL
jgi:hypothetical protein